MAASIEKIDEFNYFDEKSKADLTLVSPWKMEILQETLKILLTEGFIPESRRQFEAEWYFADMKLEDSYFRAHNAKEIAAHITSLYSAKIVSQINKTPLELDLHSVTQDGDSALFIVRSTPGAWNSPSAKVETFIDDHFLGQHEFGSGYAQRTEELILGKKDNKRWHVTCFRTGGSISPTSHLHLRLYFVARPKYISENEKSCKLDEISDPSFLSGLEKEDKEYYQKNLETAFSRLAPSVDIRPAKDEFEVVVTLRAGTTHSFFSAMSRVYHTYSLQSVRKQADQFGNGLTMFRAWIKPRKKSQTSIEQKDLISLQEDLSSVFTLPRTSLTPLVQDHSLSTQEHAYSYAAWKFAFHFLGRQSAQFHELANILKDNTHGLTLLDEIRGKTKKEAYTEQVILPIFFEKPKLLKILFKDFEEYHRVGKKTRDVEERTKNLKEAIFAEVRDDFNKTIFSAFIAFNVAILKTNFFSKKKSAISFRLDPSFLSTDDYPQKPFGIFFIVGATFRGFHVRFRDVARGGIRIVRSPNPAVFGQNAATFFDEVYNLANTQERKNKDIAEGGSKGAILLAPDHQDSASIDTSFHNYIDGLLDMLVTDNSVTFPNYLDKPELLFLGPDEGTADKMDWASEHAKQRGYTYWKAFTTGKSPSRGGIPHDLYGMTTRSVHSYVVGILNKMGLKEEEMTKIQTGGPDGDLGSNEIKISKDKTTAIVDGSGVLYDPAGINREALTVLATERKMVDNFPKDKLSPKGFFISVTDKKVTLPDGFVVEDGTDFRNSFHLSKYAKADMFVPCGGRPEAINLSNVHKAFDTDKNPLWKIIVEGANLFITQQARLILEKAGVILIKDASANKGGVTSSSLEVQAALALKDDEFLKHMCVQPSSAPPAFYLQYKDEVQEIIERNASLEFECIWNESLKSNTPRAILSDMISNKINELSLIVGDSVLWDDAELRKKVLLLSFPKVIVDLVGGLDELMARIPDSYLRAVFSCTLSARYVYSQGLPTVPEFNFYNFLKQFH